MSTILHVEGLNHAYAGQPVLSSFAHKQTLGQHCLLLGPSGSGKTTLINLISGLLSPDAGSIRICGQDMADTPLARRDALRRNYIGIIFQTLRLVGAINVRQNLLLAQKLSGGSVDQAEVDALLDRLGLTHRATARPRELSQGEAQRAAIARALVTKPALLIADEPTSALDDRNADRIGQLLLDAAEANGSTLLIATHDSRLKRFISNNVTLSPLHGPA